MTMKDFANYIIAIANEEKLPITNLQLQKVMYFGLKYVMQHQLYPSELIEAMYDQHFLVWRYGPVVKDIYETYQGFGADPIVANPDATTFPQCELLKRYIIQLIQERPFNLVDRSQRERFWIDHKRAIDGWRSDVAYQLHDIAS
ncbi:hypothetical protein PT274_03165 [Leuconostocaceae bacterium ESL0958]|nr:hypothetical protein [Leuconostocaceae bacterium ESL0958]